MPTLRTYQLFVSHSWNHSEDYWKIIQFLDAAPNFQWKNLSVPEHNPVKGKDLAYELRNQMRPADAFLIIAGMYAAYSEWIDFEMDFARRIGRPILGIVKRGSERVPNAIQTAATELVNWNGASIVQAIRKHALPTL